MTLVRSSLELVEDILDSRGDEAALALELFSRGDEAVDAIFSTVKSTMVPASHELLTVLAMAASPNKLDELRSLIDHPDNEVSTTAYQALGHIGDRSVTTLLAERLLDEKKGFVASTTAGKALAMIPDLRVADLMRERVERWLAARRKGLDWIASLEVRHGFDLIWAATLAAILAANGDQRGAPLIFDVVSLPKARRKALSGAFDMHDSTCKLLMHFACPGLLDAIQAGAKQGGNDTKQILARVLGHIGNRDAVDVLVGLSNTKHAETSEALASWLTRLTGADLPELPLYGEEIQRWWKEHRSNFSPDTNYQQGRPWKVDDLLDRATEPSDIAAHELLVVTGINITREMRARGAGKAEVIAELREESKGRFQEGHLYRHGHEVDPRSCALPLE